MFDIRLPTVTNETKYPEAEYERCFEWIKHYEAKKVQVEGKEYPTVTLMFKNSYRAKLFIYWLQKICRVEPYQAAIYLEENVEEIYKGLK